MSEISRIIIDIPRALSDERLRELRGMIEGSLESEGFPDATTTAPTMLTSTQLMEAWDSEGYGGDYIHMPNHPEFINGEDADGGYVTALIWVPGIERPVDMKRLRVLQKDGFLAGVGDKHLEGLLAYVHEQYAPDANISTADLEEIDEAYATAQEESYE